MTVGVIHIFERIQISHHHPKRKPVPDGSIELADRPIFYGSPVWETGERIRERQFLQQSVLGLNLSMELDDATPYCHPRQQFAGAVIIRSDCDQGFRDLDSFPGLVGRG